jgi:hypothetical protein
LDALDVGVTLGTLEGVAVGRVGLLDLGDEAAGADDVEGGHTEELLGVVDTLGLEDLGGDWDGAVDGVGDDEELGLGGVLSGGNGEIADDGGVGVEQVCRMDVSWGFSSRVCLFQ